MEKQKNIPELRFPGFEGEWGQLKILEVGEVITGKTPSTKSAELWEGEIQFVTPTDIDDNKYQLSTQRTIKRQVKTRVLPFKSIMFTCIASIGKMSISVFPCVTNQQINSIVPFDDYDNEFIYYTLKSIVGFIQSTQKTNTLPIINKSEFSKFKLSFPTLPEQQKIASFFTAIDQKISHLKQKHKLLEQYKKGVMQKIFSQEIRFRDDDGREFPKWEKKHGNELFSAISNKNHNSDLPILAITQDQGAIPRDLIDYNITVSEQSVDSYKVVGKGDFIISLRSFQGGIEYSNYTGICSPAYIILRATKKIDNRYFKFYFKTPSYITELNKKLEGIRDGKMISFKYFSGIEINLPSLPEQTKIANFLSAIDDKIQHTQRQVKQAEQWKKGLMQKMFV